MTSSWTPKRVLVVDPSGTLAPRIRRESQALADVEDCREFGPARKSLLENHPALLITDLRLGAYNGLHLAYLATANDFGTCSIVFAEPMDPLLAAEAQEAGAFVEWRHRLPFAVRSYLTADLPARDRRDPSHFDRRHGFRGGRRAADLPAERLSPSQVLSPED